MTQTPTTSTLKIAEAVEQDAIRELAEADLSTLDSIPDTALVRLLMVHALAPRRNAQASLKALLLLAEMKGMLEKRDDSSEVAERYEQIMAEIASRPSRRTLN